jgi:hypothetical protein
MNDKGELKPICSELGLTVANGYWLTLAIILRLFEVDAAIHIHS